MEAYIARCPTPCADIDVVEVLETVIAAPIVEDTFTSIVTAAVELDNVDIQILEMKHVVVFGLSIPGNTDDYDGPSEAAQLLTAGIGAALGIESTAVSILDATGTAYGQVHVEVKSKCTSSLSGFLKV